MIENLTVSPTHREWDDKTKAVAWHEYFHNSAVGIVIFFSQIPHRIFKYFNSREIIRKSEICKDLDQRYR